MSILQELVTLNESQWSSAVHQKWTPPEGFFTKSAKAIATGLLNASKSEAQAMARLNFYINRAGKNLSVKDQARLEGAKKILMTKNETLMEEEDIEASDAKNWAEDLESIHGEISKLMSEARGIVRHLPRQLRGSAEAYWIPHIMIALGGEHEWMTAGHESTMQRTIKELEDYAERDGSSGDDDEGDHSFGEREHGHGASGDDDDGDHSFGERGHR